MKYQLSLHADKLKKGFLWRKPKAYAVVLACNPAHFPVLQPFLDRLAHTKKVGHFCVEDSLMAQKMECLIE